MASEIRLRKEDGIVFDPNILDIDENQILVKYLDNEELLSLAFTRATNSLREERRGDHRCKFLFLLLYSFFC